MPDHRGRRRLQAVTQLWNVSCGRGLSYREADEGMLRLRYRRAAGFACTVASGHGDEPSENLWVVAAVAKGKAEVTGFTDTKV